METAAIADAPHLSRPAPTRRAYRLAMLGALTLFAVSMVQFAIRPGDDASFAVVVSPASGEAGLMQVVGAADAVLVRQSRFPWLAVVHPRGAQDPSDFQAALKNAGALLLLHPALLAGCFNQPFAPQDTRQMS